MGRRRREGVQARDVVGPAGWGSAVRERVEPAAPAAGPAVNLSLPEISGEAQAGEPLTASSGVWTSTVTPTFTYRWLLCNASGGNCSDISGATTAHYAVPDAAVGATLRVRVTASDSAGSTAALSAATSAIAAAPLSTEFPASVGAPAVSGEAQIGQTLTASTGAWMGTSPLTYTYQWLRCDASGTHCGAIAGATAATLTLAVDLLAETVRVRVTATSDAGSAEATSGATP